MFVFFKQKTAYDMRISDWSSYVCSSDLQDAAARPSDRAALAPAEVAGRDRALLWRVPLLRAADFRHSRPPAARGGAGQAHLYAIVRGLFRRDQGPIGQASCRERVVTYV